MREQNLKLNIGSHIDEVETKPKTFNHLNIGVKIPNIMNEEIKERKG